MFTFINATGMMVAIDARTGEIVWETVFDSPVLGGATVVNDLVVTATMQGELHLLEAASGRVARSFTFGSGINACPAVAGDMMVIPAAGPNFDGVNTDIKPNGSIENALIRLGLFGES